MNSGQLRAVLWLRWRLMINRVRRRGKGSNFLLALVLLVVLSVSIGLFVLALELGHEQLPEASGITILLAWTGLALAFLFFWIGGLVTELQQADTMSLKSLLHLPVSLRWVFLYNYLGTFVGLSVAMFLPAMLGLSLAMLSVFGPVLLMAFPLLLGFFVMVTGLTYQLRSWLARLMENKRHGKNIVVIMTMSFVLLAQLPNLINMRYNNSRMDGQELKWAAKHANDADPVAKAEAEAKYQAFLAEQDALEAKFTGWVETGTLVVPVGWLPLGMRAAAEGRFLASLWSALGMLAIGGLSLRRAYRKALDATLGRGGKPRTQRVASQATATLEAAGARTLMVEHELPLVSGVVAGIALANLRGMLRAPEFKMVMMRALFFLVIVVVLRPMFMTGEGAQWAGALMCLGATAMALLMVDQLATNQFGLDRDGFRAYVLSPARRDQILFAKNLALAPVALGIGTLALFGLEMLLHLDAAHFAGALAQLLSGYLLFALVGNSMSILSPIRLSSEGLKPEGSKLKFVLRGLLGTIMMMLVLTPLLIPFAVELWFRSLGWAPGVPIYLVLHLIGLLLILLLYRCVVRSQGQLLQENEVSMLEVLG